MIGNDTDQSNLSSKILTSATRNVTGILLSVLEEAYSDDFRSGYVEKYNLTNNDINVVIGPNARFSSFNENDLANIKNEILSSVIRVPNSGTELCNFIIACGFTIANDEIRFFERL